MEDTLPDTDSTDNAYEPPTVVLLGSLAELTLGDLPSSDTDGFSSGSV